MTQSSARILTIAAIVAMSATLVAQHQDWPHWRGPLATGVWPGSGVPSSWSATENVAWTRAAGRRWACRRRSSSATASIVTSQIGDGVRRPGNHPRLMQGGDAAAAGERALAANAAADGPTFFLVEAFSRADGKHAVAASPRSRRAADAGPRQAQPRDAEPVSDGALIYAWFGTGQIVALDARRQAGVAAASWQRDRAVRHSMGPRQLAGGPRRSAVAALRPRAGVVPARGRQADRQGTVARRSRQGPIVLQHAVRRRRSAAAGK